MKKLDTVLYSKKERDNALYIPEYMKGKDKDYMTCKEADIVRPPEQENNKNQKDENSFG